MISHFLIYADIGAVIQGHGYNKFVVTLAIRTKTL